MRFCMFAVCVFFVMGQLPPCTINNINDINNIVIITTIVIIILTTLYIA